MSIKNLLTNEGLRDIIPNGTVPNGTVRNGTVQNGTNQSQTKGGEMEHKVALGFEMKCMSNMMTGFIGAELTKAGFDEITVTHGWVLGFLCRHRDSVIFQKDIETRFGMPRSTVANIMKQFETKGYIVRQSDEKDTRLKRVVATEKGIQVNRETIECIDRINSIMEAGITEEEKQSFKSMTEKIMKNMEQRGFKG